MIFDDAKSLFLSPRSISLAWLLSCIKTIRKELKRFSTREVTLCSVKVPFMSREDAHKGAEEKVNLQH